MRNRVYEFLVAIVRPIAWLFFPYRLEGRENLPKDEPVLLCANHSSGWDPVLVACSLGIGQRMRVMSKKQLMDIPVLGWILKKAGVFAVDRGNSDIVAVKTAIGSLKEGWSLLIFPEGTRLKKPQPELVKGGAAMIAIRSGVRMVPVFLTMEKKLFRRVRIVIGAPYSPVYTGRKGTAEEYQANAEEIMRQIYALGDMEWK